MRLKHILLILPVTMVLATSASAIQINWGCEVDSVYRDSMGTPLDETFVVQLGYFESVLGVAFVPDAANAGQWSAQWRVFDQAVYNPETGYFSSEASMDENGRSNGNSADLGVDFSEQSAFIWIHNTETPGPAAEWFLGRSATASATTAAWTLPPKADDCCDTRVLEWSVTDLDTGDTPVYGKQGAQTGSGVYSATENNFTVQTFSFAPVPEPSSTLLLALGGAALAFRRRRLGN